MSRKLRMIGMGCAVALLSAGGVVAQDAWEEWDADGDGIGVDEWNEGFGERGVFDDWDADRDGLLSEDEFNEGVFDSYDQNDNETIEESELGDVGDDMGDGGFWDV
ncbi:MAG: hypothetical protein JXB36_19245 [Gammaproteobacteria bacterium]|nr:hypothetical protein [Gammaproteobacteria bacterium]